jgi:hypothetical protein
MRPLQDPLRDVGYLFIPFEDLTLTALLPRAASNAE